MDRLITAFDRALRTVSATPPESPLAAPDDTGLNAEERAHAAALMRVNHVGEICAQGLYDGQALTARTPAVGAHMRRAAEEEGAHLGWCAGRVAELGGRTSLLAPAWYVGAFALGALAGRSGDATSLGFVAETEKQVEAHLDGHLVSLPAADVRSREIVVNMRNDEARHRHEATAAGGVALPLPVRLAMKAMAKVMTTVAYRI